MRLYLPATLEILQALHDDGVMGVGDDVVVAESDTEDEEYDALMTAAESAGLLAAELEPGERRRVVVVAEVPGSHPPSRISIADVVAVHADPDDVPDEGADPDDDLGLVRHPGDPRPPPSLRRHRWSVERAQMARETAESVEPDNILARSSDHV